MNNKLTKKQQIELIEQAKQQNEKILESLKSNSGGSIPSLQIMATIEGKILAYNDVLELLNGNSVMLKIEVGL